MFRQRLLRHRSRNVVLVAGVSLRPTSTPLAPAPACIACITQSAPRCSRTQPERESPSQVRVGYGRDYGESNHVASTRWSSDGSGSRDGVPRRNQRLDSHPETRFGQPRESDSPARSYSNAGRSVDARPSRSSLRTPAPDRGGHSGTTPRIGDARGDSSRGQGAGQYTAKEQPSLRFGDRREGRSMRREPGRSQGPLSTRGEGAKRQLADKQPPLGALVTEGSELSEAWGKKKATKERDEIVEDQSRGSHEQRGRLKRLEHRAVERQEAWGRGPKGQNNSPNEAASPKVWSAKPKLQKQVKREVYLPNFVTTNNLARMLGIKMRSLQNRMTELGFADVRPDLLLPFSDAELIAAEYDLAAIADEEAAFDLYPRPEPSSSEEASALPLRPPVVTIMGHVDHGKTTLLDKLRSTSVAAGEAGGITQHIGAFKVPVSKAVASANGTLKTVTFLDTPGHAAFSAMRSRGAVVTDIVVLVVAADDGIMPQTREVIDVLKALSADATMSASSGGERKQRRGGDGAVQLVVALNKVDKPEAAPEEVKRELLAAGVELEDFGGDVPCVEVSGKTGAGLAELEETLAALAEMAELRAEQDGPAEGYVLESRTEKGRGNIATVLVKRGKLKAGDLIVAGQAYAKVRALMDDRGKPLKVALPGDPVLVLGWRELPQAGDELLTAPDEAAAKRAIANRQRVQEQVRLGQDVEAINEGRRAKAEEDREREKREFEERQRKRALRIAESEGKVARDPITGAPILRDQELVEELTDDKEARSPSTSTAKEYRLIVKADFSGTVEAVVGAISGIGNAEARVKVVASGVGDVSEGDIDMAAAVGGHVLAFNLTPSKAVLASAARRQPSVTVRADDVIYRLMTYVTENVEALLAPRKEHRVTGEAIIQQIFPINVKGRVFRNVAGCRVSNGLLARTSKVRVLRAGGTATGSGSADGDDEGIGSGRRVLWSGELDSVKHLKNEVDEVRKGMECGLAFRGFQDIQPGDIVQSYNVVEVPRHL